MVCLYLIEKTKNRIRKQNNSIKDKRVDQQGLEHLLLDALHVVDSWRDLGRNFRRTDRVRRSCCFCMFRCPLLHTRVDGSLLASSVTLLLLLLYRTTFFMALSRVRLLLLLVLFLWLLLLLVWLMVLNVIVAFEDNKHCTMVLVDFVWTVPGFSCPPAGPHILTTEDVVHSSPIPGQEIVVFQLIKKESTIQLTCMSPSGLYVLSLQPLPNSPRRTQPCT